MKYLTQKEEELDKKLQKAISILKLFWNDREDSWEMKALDDFLTEIEEK